MQRGTGGTNSMLPDEATSDNGLVRIVAYASYRSIIVYRGPEPCLIVMVPNISGTFFLANGIYLVSIIPRNPFSYWIPSGILTNTLVMHVPSHSVPLSHFSWNWSYPVINHTPRFAGVNHGPSRMPLYPSNFHVGLLAIQDQVENANTGLSREVIFARMNCIKYQSIERSVSDNDTCCICLDDFSDGQNIGSIDCQHTFHSDCISQWLMRKNSCPLCKRIALAN